MANGWTTAAALLLGSCASAPATSTPATGDAEIRRWLIGTWAPVDVSCESDGGIIYRADGTWQAYGAEGSWSISGGSLATTVLRQDDDEPARLDPPSRSAERFTARARDEYRTIDAQGERYHNRRCP